MASIAPEVIKERVKVNKNFWFSAYYKQLFKAVYNDDTLPTNLFSSCSCIIFVTSKSFDWLNVQWCTLPTNLISSCRKLEHYFCNIQKWNKSCWN
jgi:hypothetical protein